MDDACDRNCLVKMGKLRSVYLTSLFHDFFRPFRYDDSTTPPTINGDPKISAPVIGLYSNINPMIMATKGSKLDNMEAFEASTCLMF